MKKMWIVPVLVICLLFLLGTQITAYAAGDHYTEGYFEYSMTSDSITIESYFGSESEVVIPDHIAALPVTKIVDAAFAENTTVTKVTIPETVTAIGQDVFTGMKQLKEVVVQSVGLTVRVPSGCTLTEDYPVYVKPGSDSSEGTSADTIEQNPDNSGSDSSNNSNEHNVAGNGNAEDKGTVDSNVGFEAAAESADDTQDRPGIRTSDDRFITVDNSNHLIEIDANGDVRVLDRDHQYSVTQDKNGDVIIKDNEGTQVSLDKDGNMVARTEEGKAKSSNRAGLGILLMIGLVIVAAAGMIFWKKQKNRLTPD